jgi:hypothetical protein
MSTKSMAYDHPTYVARSAHVFPALAAGASGATSKFVAFTNMTIFAIVANAVATGSSTTSLWNGTAVQQSVGNDSLSLIRIMNNAAAGAAPSLSTATYGPFSVNNYNGTATGTTTNSSAPGYTNVIALYGTGTTGSLQTGSNAGLGGITVNQGDQLYIQRGTDATAITAVALEIGVTPLANVTL